MSQGKAPILAFAHIGKTGGTTLIHLLRRNYFLQYCDVLPLDSGSGKLLSPSDLRKILRINPLLRCIAGHSIRPYGELKAAYPNLQYITLLRDPINRCVSQYQQRVKKHGHVDFKEFLDRDWLPDLQTRFIAGTDDVEKAKEIIVRDFLVAGVLEEFDAFLAVLMEKVKPKRFDPVYTAKRVARDKDAKQHLIERYYDDIAARHQRDLELYRFVKEESFAQEKRSLGGQLARNLREIRVEGSAVDRAGRQVKTYTDYMLRKVYYEPLLGGLRSTNGSAIL